MNDNQIIKQDVKPILTNVEKIRYSLAAQNFVGGMSSYIVNYIKGIKDMVNTKQVQKAYTSQYTSRAKEYVKRFNQLSQNQQKEKRKVLPMLAIFTVGGIVFYKAIKSVQEKFAKEMKAFNEFFDDLMRLMRVGYKRLMEETKLWTLKHFGVAIDLENAIGRMITGLPTLIKSMFDVICDGLYFIFIQSDIFQTMIINTALMAYNASFESSWGWVLGLVMSRAKEKIKRQRASTRGYARFGPDLQKDMRLVTEMLNKKFLDGSAWTEWGGEFNHDSKKYKVSGKLSSADANKFSPMLPANANSTNTNINQGASLIVDDDIFQSLSFDEVYQPLSGVTLSQTEVTVQRVDYYVSNYRGSINESPNRSQKQIQLQQEKLAEYGSTPVYISGKIKIKDLYTIVGPNDPVLVKLGELHKKYNHLYNKSNQTITKLINVWHSFTNHNGTRKPALFPDGVHELKQDTLLNILRLLKAWLIFDYVYQRNRYEVSQARYHSRFEVSTLDLLKEKLLQEDYDNVNDPITELYKNYTQGSIDFVYFLRKASQFLTTKAAVGIKTNSTAVGGPVKHVINPTFMWNTYNYKGVDIVRWRDKLAIPLIVKRLQQIKQGFNILYYHKIYGNYYTEGNEAGIGITFISDDVSNWGLDKDADGKYLGLYKARSADNPQGIEVGWQDLSVTNTPIEKSRLESIVNDIVRCYTSHRQNIEELRWLRAEKFNEIVFYLLCLSQYQKDYEKITEDYKKINNQ